MTWSMKDTTVAADKFSTATEFYSEIRAGLRKKADHSKTESQWVFVAIIMFTLISPLFVSLGEGTFWGKIVPATLSVFAGGLTAWLQLRKPQRLWAMYRRAQRELEREKSFYDFNLGNYENADDKDRILAARVSDISFSLHEQWEGLVPESDALGSIVPLVAPKQTEEKI